MEKIFTVNNILDILLRRLWLIVVLVCLGGGVAYVYSSYIVQEKYTSSVTMYVYNPNPQQQNMTTSDFMLSQKLVDTYMVILKSNHVLDKVSDQIAEDNIKYSASAISGMISAEAVEETEVFKVSVSTHNKEHSKIIADTIAQIAPDEIIRVVKAGAVEIVDNAQLPEKPSYPNVSRNTIIGIILGLVFACVFAIVLELMNTSVKSRDDLSETHKYPILAVIPNLDGRSKSSKSYYSYKKASKGYSYNYGYGYGYGYGVKKGSKKETEADKNGGK